jgi:hypothetical protein
MAERLSKIKSNENARSKKILLAIAATLFNSSCFVSVGIYKLLKESELYQ